MKKTFFYLLGALLIIPLKIEAAYGLTLNDFRNTVFRPVNLPGGETGNVAAETKVNDILNFLINFILFASGSVAVIMLIYGGFVFVTSSGNEEQKSKAIQVIKTALIGLLAVILAYALVTNIISLIYRATS